MAARPVLMLTHLESDGDVLGSKTIVVTKPDGSALGVALYDQATGGAPVASPQTDSVGTKLLYADHADLDAGGIGRVKVAYSDVPATTFDDAFWPDPADLFVDGMTRARALGGALTVGGALTADGALAANDTLTANGLLAVGGSDGLAASISDAANYAGSFRNRQGGLSTIEMTNGGTGYLSAPSVSFAGGGGSGAAGTAIRSGDEVISVTVTNAGSGYTSAPTVVFTGGSGTGAAATALLSATTLEALGPGGGQTFVVDGDMVHIPAGKKFAVGTTGVPATSTLYVTKTTGFHYVVSDVGLIATGVYTVGQQDAGAFRAFAQQTNTAGNSAIRALEGRATRLAPAVIGPTWGLELNVTSDVAGSSISHIVGAFIQSGSGLVGEQRADVGILLTGPAGWKHLLYALDTDGTTVLLDVSQTGQITSGAHLSRTHNSFDLGSTINYWRTVFGGAFLALDGSAASPSLTFGADSDVGLFRGGTNILGLASGAEEALRLDANHNVVMGRVAGGTFAALATTATGGFPYIPTCAGTPTGVPATAYTGRVPLVYDTTANKIWFYNGSWRGVVVA